MLSPANKTELITCTVVLAVTLTFSWCRPAQAASSALAWGRNTDGQCIVPSGLGNVRMLAAGDSHSVVLKANGEVTAWGLNSVGQTTVPAGLTGVAAIAARNSYSMALSSNGTVWAWGQAPALPAGMGTLVAIAAGRDHCLGLRPDGTVVSWGSSTAVPNNLANVVALAAGNSNSLALKQDGTVLAWGNNAFGKATVPAGLAGVQAIAAGNDHCLALKADGTVVAWGANTLGQLNVPAGLGNVVAISAGSAHSLALKKDGTLVAWGDNSYNQAVINSSASNFVGIAAGAFHSLALAGDGSPVIMVQPKDQTVITTKDASFSVAAIGTAALRYQWQHGGIALAGETNSSLTVRNAALKDAGEYRVTVANNLGAVLSSPATLVTIETAPFITLQPQNQSALCGESVSFQAAADGSAPISYQWLHENDPVPGATTSTLTLTNLTRLQAGLYCLVAANSFGSVTSSPASLTIVGQPTTITSPLTAQAAEGQEFSYQITGMHSPDLFGATGLPPGLAIDTATGLISGQPLTYGVFGVLLTAANSCASASATLVLTIASSAPIITSPLMATGIEENPFTYQITATNAPQGFGADNLPIGLIVDSGSGTISGSPIYAGQFTTTIWASNQWGKGSAQLAITVTNATIQGLSIANVTTNYSSPYLLDFTFSLRDNEDPAQGKAVVAPPRLLSVVCMEDGKRVSPSETAVMIQGGKGGSTKQIKTSLVLDFSESLASLANGDTNFDGISDAVDAMVASAQAFVKQQAADTQIAVYEFHRDDMEPQKVLGMTSDKAALNSAIAGIWTNYVQWFPAGSRCWDALVDAIGDMDKPNPDEAHYVVFVSDGQDESSFSLVEDVISAATNQNVKVYCVGFGSELDPAPLQEITTATSGRYYTAANAAELATEFARIGKDLAGQYVLRWATLKRSTNSFMPSFQISYQSYTANSPTNPVWEDLDNPIIDTNAVPPTTNYPLITNFIISPYTPSMYTGAVTVGKLRLIPDAEVLPTGMTLRASYIPRLIRQMRLHYRANWPCTPLLQSTNEAEILQRWTLSETNDGTGGKWLLLSSPYPESTTNSIPFASFGRLLTFSFRDVVDPTNAFSLFEVDNTIYTNTGKQTFVLENTNEFLKVYAVLPFGTPVPWLIAHGYTNNFPAAELADPDGDGFLNWQEYRGNTDPRDAQSRLYVRTLLRGLDGRYILGFPTATNRLYEVESSADLQVWDVVETAIPGTGSDVAITDTRYLPGVTQLYYRVRAY